MSTEKYIDLIGVINTAVRGQSGTVVQFGSTSDLDRREVLAWLDAHPDQVPGRTITESEINERWRGMTGSPTDFAESIGITVIPDPKPTPRQRLEALIFEKWGDADDAQMITMSILDEFDVSVKAPGGENDE